MGVPPNHPLYRFFSIINHLAIGVPPPFYGNPQKKHFAKWNMLHLKKTNSFDDLLTLW